MLLTASEIPDRTYEAFPLHFSFSSTLTSLTLDLIHIPPVYFHVINSLLSLTKLQHLEINYGYYWDIPGEDTLINSLLQNASHLKSLILCGALSERRLIDLFEGLTSLVSLTCDFEHLESLIHLNSSAPIKQLHIHIPQDERSSPEPFWPFQDYMEFRREPNRIQIREKAIHEDRWRILDTWLPYTQRLLKKFRSGRKESRTLNSLSLILPHYFSWESELAPLKGLEGIRGYREGAGIELYLVRETDD